MPHKKASILALLISLMFMSTLIETAKSSLIWSDEWQLTHNIELDGYPSIAQMNDDRIWVVWKSRRTGNPKNSNIFYKVYNGTWSNDKALTLDSREDIGPSITQAKDSKIWVVWSANRTGQYRIYYKTSSDNGATWSSDTQITDSTYDDYHPSILSASNGTIWVVWDRSISNNNEIFYKVFNGSSWSSDQQITTDPNWDMQPVITQTQGGKIWVVWSSNRIGAGENYEIFYKTFNGTAWSIDYRLTTDTQKFDMEPTIFQTSNGTIWIIWSARGFQPNDTNDLYFKTSDDNGATWSNTIQLTTDPSDDNWPSAIQTHDRSIWIIWGSNRGTDGNWELWGKVTLKGDVNNDGYIDTLDMAYIARALGTNPTWPHWNGTGTPGWDQWNPNCDLDNNGKVDLLDLATAGSNYGKYS